MRSPGSRSGLNVGRAARLQLAAERTKTWGLCPDQGANFLAAVGSGIAYTHAVILVHHVSLTCAPDPIHAAYAHMHIYAHTHIHIYRHVHTRIQTTRTYTYTHRDFLSVHECTHVHAIPYADIQAVRNTQVHPYTHTFKHIRM